jgi:ribonuclease T2
MLSSGGIQVSNGKEYALSDVIDTIKHAFGGSPQIVCKSGSVQELRLCFDKELKVSFPFSPLEQLPTICCYKILQP